MSRRKSAAQIRTEAGTDASSAHPDTNQPQQTPAEEQHSVLATVAANGVQASMPTKSAPQYIEAGKRFLKCCAESKIDLAHLRKLVPKTGGSTRRPGSGTPVFPGWLMGFYLEWLAAQNKVKRTSMEGNAAKFRGWLVSQGWDTTEAVTTSGLFCKNYRRDEDEAYERVQAREILDKESIAITLHIDQLISQYNPKTSRVLKVHLLAIRTFHLVQWCGAFRAAELTTKICWEWIDFEAGVIHTPGDDLLKRQIKQLDVAFPARPGNPDMCPHRALKAWRAELQLMGFPTGDKDLVFPFVKKTSHEKSRWVGPVVVDRIALAEAKHTAAGLTEEELATAMHSLVRYSYQRYYVGWREYVEAAGCGARHAGEGPGTHGNRSGNATELHNKGASPVLIGQKLRHKPTAGGQPHSWTQLYVRTTPKDTNSLLPEQGQARAQTPLKDLTTLIQEATPK